MKTYRDNKNHKSIFENETSQSSFEKVWKSQTFCRNAIVSLLHFDSDGEAWFRWSKNAPEKLDLEQVLSWCRLVTDTVMDCDGWELRRGDDGQTVAVWSRARWIDEQSTAVRLESGQEAPPCSIVGEWRPQSGGARDGVKGEAQRWDSRGTETTRDKKVFFFLSKR